jgi:protein-S-isoprenylcysteine O-methyltransferase Ste14
MRTATAALGSALFFLLAPVTIAGVIPWWLTRWRVNPSLPYGRLVQSLGGLLIVLGAGVLLHAFTRFVVEGSGTPAPVAPATRLVIGGLYRYVRNPMYLAVLAAIFGQAVLLGAGPLLAYAAGIALAFALFVRFYEEPTLRSQFGAEYERYCLAVPAWWPRLHPWRGDRR